MRKSIYPSSRLSAEPKSNRALTSERAVVPNSALLTLLIDPSVLLRGRISLAETTRWQLQRSSLGMVNMRFAERVRQHGC